MYVIIITFIEESLWKEHNHSYQLIFLPPTVQLLSIYHTDKIPNQPKQALSPSCRTCAKKWIR